MTCPPDPAGMTCCATASSGSANYSKFYLLRTDAPSPCIDDAFHEDSMSTRSGRRPRAFVDTFAPVDGHFDGVVDTRRQTMGHSVGILFVPSAPEASNRSLLQEFLRIV